MCCGKLAGRLGVLDQRNVRRSPRRPASQQPPVQAAGPVSHTAGPVSCVPPVWSHRTSCSQGRVFNTLLLHGLMVHWFGSVKSFICLSLDLCLWVKSDGRVECVCEWRRRLQCLHWLFLRAGFAWSIHNPAGPAGAFLDRPPCIPCPGSSWWTLLLSLSRVHLCDPMDRSTPGLLSITSSRSLLRVTTLEAVMPSNHFVFCRPLLLPPTILPSIRVFFSVSALHIRWPKYWSFSFNISPSVNILGWFPLGLTDLLAVQGTLTSIHDYWKNHGFD